MNDTAKHDIEILKTVIRRAIKGGWEQQLHEDPWDVHQGGLKGRYVICIPHADEQVTHIDMAAIVFDHTFALALWGDPWAHFTDGRSGDTISGNFINYLGHLANMAVSERFIDYLELNGGKA